MDEFSLPFKKTDSQPVGCWGTQDGLLRFVFEEKWFPLEMQLATAAYQEKNRQEAKELAKHTMETQTSMLRNTELMAQLYQPMMQSSSGAIPGQSQGEGPASLSTLARMGVGM
jgi:hypothetical protein